ncbi:pectinesterase family protein [Saccharobesus litoralis]|nr:pectinesterase family protein [Saccharobesus litoralis]
MNIAIISRLFLVGSWFCISLLSSSVLAKDLGEGASVEYHAYVSHNQHHAPNNIPTFTTIAAALEAAPTNAAIQPPTRHIIFISAGDYYEKLTVSKPNIALVGAGKAKTRIHYDVYAGLKRPNADKKWGTFDSATLKVDHLNFYAENLTIENSYDYPANDKLAKTDPLKQRHSQAVALTLGAGAHRAVFNNVAIKGYQDTVFVDGGINYFYQSDIYGHVDFIFGRGNALFEQSNIINRRRFAPQQLKYTGYVTAPSTYIKQEFGFTFKNCRFEREAGVPDYSVPLGRPWHPTTTFKDGRYADPRAIGKTVVLNSYLDKHISLDGWSSMKGTSRIKGQKDVFMPESARFFEYNNTGPGANITDKRRQLSAEQAKLYSNKNILSGWQPKLSALQIGQTLAPQFSLLPSHVSQAIASQISASQNSISQHDKPINLVKVTNLQADGSGSLRAALQQKGPKHIVFEVAGVIDLAGQSLVIDQPYTYVYGQTAPYPGVTIIKGGIGIQSHDIVLQHLKIRPGDKLQAKRSGWAPDAVGISRERAFNIWLDHLSLTWAVDENIGITSGRINGYAGASHDIWVTNSIIAEALDYATHKKGKHSKGVLVHDYVHDVHFYGNLFAHNDRRNPYFKTAATGSLIGNVIYNPGSAAIHMGYIAEEFASYRAALRPAQLLVKNNLLLYGRDTYSDLALVSGFGQALLGDNKVSNLDAADMPISTTMIQLADLQLGSENGQLSLAQRQTTFPPVPQSNVDLNALLSKVGAIPWQRDEIDQRIVQSVTTARGRVIDSQQDVGGYPSYPAVYRAIDPPRTQNAFNLWLNNNYAL